MHSGKVRPQLAQERRQRFRDALATLNFLFLGGPPPTCTEAANANDDGSVNITDGIYVLNFLFLGTPGRLPCGERG